MSKTSTTSLILLDQAKGADEGRGMAQIIHDLAADSAIDFAADRPVPPRPSNLKAPAMPLPSRTSSTAPRLRRLAALLLLGGAAACHPDSSPRQAHSAAPSAPAAALANLDQASGRLELAASRSAGGGNAIPIPDAQLGMSEGELPLLPGWRGSAHVDRTSDPEAGGTATLVVQAQSGDGSASVEALPRAFHTYSPQLGARVPPQARQSMTFTSFTSTADILSRYVVPRLGLGGQASGPVPFMQDKRAAALQQAAAMGMSGPIFDSATVTVQEPGGRETLVLGVTTGGGRGTSMEMTSTAISLIRARSGQAMGILENISRLPPLKPNSAWAQADAQLNTDKLARMNADGAQFRQRMTAAGEGQRRQARASMAAQRAQFEAHDQAQAARQQRMYDLNGLAIGRLGGNDVSYRWCSAGGGEREVINDVTSPGEGYHRC